MTLVKLVIFLAVAPQLSAGEIDQKFHNVLFRQWPMLMTHDAATGYAKDGTCKTSVPVNNFAVTQPSGGFTKQLECGARAFDLRPYVKHDGKVVMHHGDVVFDTDIKVAMGDIMKWSESHPNTIVFLNVGTTCGGDNEEAKKKCWSTGAGSPDSIIEGAGAKYRSDASLKTLTVGEVLTHAKWKSGGAVIYTWAASVESNWVESIQCYGRARRLDQNDLNGTDMANAPDRELIWNHLSHAAHQVADAGTHAANKVKEGGKHAYQKGKEAYSSVKDTCWAGDQQKFFDPFWCYFDQTANKNTPPLDKMYITQAHWQYDAKSIAIATARQSCIIYDEEHSKMNQKVADKISKNTYKNLAILQVDNVCDHGPALARALLSQAEKRLSNAQQKFDSSLPMLAEPRAPNFKTAIVFLVGGFGVVSAAIAVFRKGFPGCRSSAVADYGTVYNTGEA